jgi:hypothetical protein
MAKVARDYPGIPGCSVASERVCSRAGVLITNKRNRLVPESADSSTCLRYWLGLPEVTEDERKRFEESLEEGKEHEFSLDHYLPEDDGLGNDDTTHLRYCAADAGTLCSCDCVTSGISARRSSGRVHSGRLNFLFFIYTRFSTPARRSPPVIPHCFTVSWGFFRRAFLGRMGRGGRLRGALATSGADKVLLASGKHHRGAPRNFPRVPHECRMGWARNYQIALYASLYNCSCY